MKILVIGKNGQLGRSIHKIVINNELRNVFVFVGRGELDFSQNDNIEKYFKENSFDVVVNGAAYTAVDKAESEIELTNQINHLAVRKLAEIAYKKNIKLIHISTDYVFDGEACLPYSETDQVNPNGVYGKTKLEGEQNCLKENPHVLIIRTSWLYSAFGNNFVKTMLKLGNEKKELNVVFNQVGTPTYAADLAGAILLIIQDSEKEREKFVPGIYHYSNEGVASWYDFANAVFEISRLNCQVKPVLSNEFPTQAKRPNFSVLDKSKIKNTFRLKIPFWRESLGICLKKLEKIG